jgi:hypothetical protein
MVLNILANIHNETISRETPYIIGEANKNMLMMLPYNQTINTSCISWCIMYLDTSI